jgi:hypothetical protein
MILSRLIALNSTLEYESHLRLESHQDRIF